MIFALTSLVFSLNTTELQTQLQGEIERAQTWYVWGRDAQNSESYFIRSKAHYSAVCEAILQHAGLSKTAIEKLKSGTEPSHCDEAERRASPELQNIAAVARGGFDQSEWRIDNAWDNFRSRYPGVWWLIGADPTLELVDDLYMNAFAQAWGKLAVGIPFVKTPRLPFLVRCHGGHDICGNYRDELHGATATDSRLHAIPDDRGRQLLGADWDRLIASDQKEPEALSRLGRALDATAIMVVDVRVADEFGLPPSERMASQYCIADADGEIAPECMHVVRAYMRYQVIKVAGGTAMGGGEAHGVAIDLTSRTGVRALWVFVWLLVALGFGITRGLRARASVKRNKNQAFGFQLIAATVAFAVGGFVGVVAGDVSGSFAPDWGELAATAVPGPLEGLPRVGVILWPIVHGLVVMVGPAVLCAFVAIRYLPEWAMAWNTRMDADVIIPSAQAGAVSTLFAPLLAFGVVEPNADAWDWQVALSISIAAVITSVWLSRSLARFLNADSKTTPVQTAMLVLGFVLMALLLPLGLYHGGSPDSHGWHLGVSAVISALAIAGIVIFGRPVSVYALEASRRAAAEKFNAEEGFGLNRPRFLEIAHSHVAGGEGLSIDDELTLLRKREGLQILVLESESGLGKTRTADELRRRLSDSSPVDESDDDEGDRWSCGYAAAQAGDEPYALIQGALAAIGITGDLSTREAQLDRSQQLAEAMGETIGLLPGGALLNSLGGGGSEDGKSQERIIHDIERDLRERGEDENILLVFDDVEQADQSSLAVLQGLLQRLSEADRTGDEALSVIICVELPDQDGEVLDHAKGWDDRLTELDKLLSQLAAGEGNAQVMRVKIPNLQTGQIGDLLENAGVLRNWSEDFEELLRNGSQNGRAYHVLELVRTLEDHGHIVPVPDYPDMLQVREGVSHTEITRAVPKDIYDGQINRLKALNPEERLVLHCASICGRSFSVTNIARGLSRPRLEVLRILQQIEDEHGFIEDVIEDDDRFRFLNSITIAAMEQWLEKTEIRGGHGRELVKEMHREVARKMIDASKQEEDSVVSLSRIAFHCRHAGPSMLKDYRDFTARAAHAAAQQGAYPEVFEQVRELGLSFNWHESLQLSAQDADEVASEQGEELEAVEPDNLRHRHWGEISTDRKAAFDLAWAKACTGFGGQENRDRARRLLRPIIDAYRPEGEGDLFPALSLYLEVTYEEEQVSELEALIEETRGWLSDPKWGEPMWRIACEFYLERASVFIDVRSQRARARNENKGYKRSQEIDRREVFAARLVELRDRLSALPQDRRRDLLMAKLLLAQAQQGAMIVGDTSGPVDEQRYNERMEKALTLLKTHRDQVAVAQAYMDQSQHFLSLNEWSTAQRYLLRSEETLETVGSRQGISRLRSLQSRCAWAQAEETSVPSEEDALRCKAFDLAETALNIALEKSRERDEVFAASQMLAYSDNDLSRLSRLERLFRWDDQDGERGCLVDPDVWKEIHEGDGIRPKISTMLKPHEDGVGWGWKLGVKLAWAKACHGRRGQTNRDIARKLLKNILKALAEAPERKAPFALFEPVSLYLEITYAEKQRSDLDELIETADQWLADTTWGLQPDPLTRIVTRFFRLMSNAFRDEWATDRPQAQVLEEQVRELKELRQEIEALSLEEGADRCFSRDRYRARLIREIAWAEVRLAGAQEAQQNIFDELMNESLRLSQKDSDLLGEAANYSMQGDFALSFAGRHRQAQELFEKTRQRAQRARYEDSQSKLSNRQARCAWLEAKELQRGTAFYQKTDQAFRLAWRAWREAEGAERERDQIHASINLMDFYTESGGQLAASDAADFRAELLKKKIYDGDHESTLDEAMKAMGEALQQAELWDELYPQDELRTRVRQCLTQLNKLEATWNWVSEVEAQLDGRGAAEA